MKANVEQAIAGINMNKTKVIQHRLREIDDARNDYISLIAAGTIDEESFDEQFQMLYDEEQELNAKLKSLQEKSNIDLAKRPRISKVMQEIDNNSC